MFDYRYKKMMFLPCQKPSPVQRFKKKHCSPLVDDVDGESLTAGPIPVSSNRRPAIAKLKRSESEVLIFVEAAACDTGTHSRFVPRKGPIRKQNTAKTELITHNIGYP